MSHEPPRSLENDGHRTVLRRTGDAVILYARSGRIVTSHWMDLAVPAMQLRPGTTLDGEAVIWREGRLDFGAVQARAASSLTRAYALAARHPASYAAFDVLEHPDHGPSPHARTPSAAPSWPTSFRASAPPIQATPSTDSRTLAMEWYDVLQAQGLEGVVAKPGRSPYPFGRRTAWVKIRQADTVDARVVGSARPRRRPRRLALLLPGTSQPRLSATPPPALAARLGAALADTPAAGEGRAGDETYMALDTELVVEVLAGSGRHGTLTVVRMR
ncbi:DNA ligase [Streptomyces microflavus]|uniref:ATP-dependent DNA ligase n=1 Tax=Streptomyces microflavus TaxID=1919 RepID=UPI0029BF282B|nr:DNA ligase [Streptomyces microflavus]MDX2407292.1 DNA ligase [Streptomyces microflavus]